MTPALAALYDLQTHLAGITPAAGYVSHVQAVHTGVSATVTGSQAKLPTLSLTTQWDDPEGGEQTETGISGMTQSWRRQVQLEGFVAVPPDGQWERALDTLIDDVHRALVRYRHPLRIGRITYASPADNGGEVASFEMPLSFPYRLKYSIEF